MNIDQLTKKELIKEVLFYKGSLVRTLKLCRKILDEWKFWNKVNIIIWIMAFVTGICFGVMI